MAERINRFLIDKMRFWLKRAGVQEGLWKLAALSAAYLEKRMETHTLNMCTTHEMFLENVRAITHISIFWCRAFVNSNKAKEMIKLDDHANKGVNAGRKGGLNRLLIRGTD